MEAERKWGIVGRGFLLHALYSDEDGLVLCGANMRTHRVKVATPEQLVIRGKCMKCSNMVEAQERKLTE